MPTTLIGQSTETFSGIQLTQYVNDAQGTHFNNIAQAITGLGLTVVGAIITNPIATAIATGLGLTLSIEAVISAIEEAIDDSDLESTIDRMEEGDSLKVTTKFYEWSSGSGNHYTYYSTESYQIV